MKWINIEERLPPNDVCVLVASYDGREKVKMYSVLIASHFNNNWIDGHNGEVINPKYGIITHWMPLPDNPSLMKKVFNE